MNKELKRPSLGGLGYPVSQRAEILKNHALGLPVSASQASISRWKQRLHPKERKKGAKNHLSGEYLELLKLYRAIYPKAHIAEISNFIFRRPRIFYPSMISRAEKAMQNTRKIRIGM